LREDKVFIPVHHASLSLGIYNTSISHILVSHAFFTNDIWPLFFEQQIDYIGEDLKGIRFVLDSGAYSAWTKGYDPDINEYADFCIKWAECFDWVFNLDVIGDCRASMKNYLWLKERFAGTTVRVVPVWHTFSGLDLLREYIDLKPYLIGLGGVTKGSMKKRQDFLRTGVTYCQEAGIKTHALGVGSLWALEDIPVDFADSTVWFYLASRGKMWTPFHGFPWVDIGKAHLTNPASQEQVDSFFSSKDRSDFVARIADHLKIDFITLRESNDDLALFNLEALAQSMQARVPQFRKRRVVF